jgi:hypothetical protein
LAPAVAGMNAATAAIIPAVTSEKRFIICIEHE